MAVLSVQSHVVYGHAGNSAAVFPMQRLGLDVWAINTVEFSNHTGYGAWRGKVLDAQLVFDLITGLEERGVLKNCDAVLSGYLGDADAGRAIAEAVEKARKYSTNAIYCCDPVMGDTGRGFYVKPDIPDIFKNKLIPLANIVCPNQFELQALTDIEIKTIDDAIKAINLLHNMGPSVVLMTSFKEKAEELSMLASDKNNLYKITTAELPLGNGVAGTGDMTAAIFLSRYLETKDLLKTLELCTSSVFGILEATYKAKSSFNNNPVELKIIEAQEQLISPTKFFKAEKINL
jgi:pyridoxine kinase